MQVAASGRLWTVPRGQRAGDDVLAELGGLRRQGGTVLGRGWAPRGSADRCPFKTSLEHSPPPLLSRSSNVRLRLAAHNSRTIPSAPRSVLRHRQPLPQQPHLSLDRLHEEPPRPRGPLQPPLQRPHRQEEHKQPLPHLQVEGLRHNMRKARPHHKPSQRYCPALPRPSPPSRPLLTPVVQCTLPSNPTLAR